MKRKIGQNEPFFFIIVLCNLIDILTFRKVRLWPEKVDPWFEIGFDMAQEYCLLKKAITRMWLVQGWALTDSTNHALENEEN